MGLSGRGARHDAEADLPEAAVWHELECGRYRADLRLWRGLARELAPAGSGARVLDVGAGTGRVTLDLARAGHSVTAVEPVAELAAVLERRARGLPVRVIRADARELPAELGSHGLVIVAMQTLQLFGGSRGRRRFLASARAHLASGGVLACAIIEHLDPFDVDAGDAAPPPDCAMFGPDLYASQPVRVRSEPRRTVIERERSVAPGDGPGAADIGKSLHADRIDRLSAQQLELEGRRAGFAVLPRRAVPATGEHVGSVVVMLGA